MTNPIIIIAFFVLVLFAGMFTYNANSNERTCVAVHFKANKAETTIVCGVEL